MHNYRTFAPLLLATVVALAACAPAPGARTATSNEPARPAGPKRITGAILSGEPVMLRSSAGGGFGGSAAGIDAIEDLVHAGATRRDDADELRPVLIEARPSIENGLWMVSPDGRMETTWKIRNGARWQDGTPFASQDLLFTLAVCMDDAMVGFCRHVGFDFIDSARAVDDGTAIVTWKQPFIEADALFTTQFGMPLPRHLLERPYREAELPRGLADLSYFTKEFVGAGPYQVREWVEASHMILRAYDGYILGRPKIDEIVIKWIADPNAIVANMLAGEIDLSLGRGIALEQAIQIRDQWPEGRLEVGLVNWIAAYPQFIDPRPAILLDARFRKGLVHALDRQEMADTLQWGMTPVRHAIFDTSEPQFRELDRLVVKYEFDQRRAAQLVESTGHPRAADGSFRDSSGQRLSVEVRITGTQDILQKLQLSIADYWQRAGIGAETLVIGRARINDYEYRATRAAFEMQQSPDTLKGLRRAHSSQTPLPENNFRVTSNTSRYMNPAFDAMLDRFFSAIPGRERLAALGQILNHMSDQVTLIPLFSGTEPMLAHNRIIGIGSRKASEGTAAWNVHEWDLR